MTQWRRVKLIDVCREITDGSHFSPKSGSGSWPYITVRDLTDGQIDLVNCAKIDKPDFDLLIKNGCRPYRGDVLFSKDGTVGKVAIVDTDNVFVVLSSLAILRPDNDLINSEFLRYIMLSPDVLEQAIGMKTGAAIRRIILRNLKSVEFSLPPLPEQQRIVGILDHACEGIAKAKANTERSLANARSVFQTYLNECFSESLGLSAPKTVDQICDVRGGKRVPKGYKFEAEPTDYRYVTVTSFSQSGSINIEKTNFISSDVFDSLKRYQINSGEIYLSIAGTIGRSGIFPDNTGRCILTENACRMIVKPNVSSMYIYLYMQSNHFMDQVAESTRTAAQPKLALERLKSILVPSDPIEKQIVMADSLAELMDRTTQLEDTYNRKMQALDELKSSILHQAFSGNI